MNAKTFWIALATTAAFATANTGLAQEAEFPNQVSFGSNFNLGWGGSASFGNTNKDLDDWTNWKNDFSLFYLYGVNHRVQLGFDLAISSDKTEFDYKTRGNAESETRRRAFYFVGVYNFSDQLRDAWYGGLALGKEWVETDVDNLSSDYDVDAIQIFAGKRMSLKDYGLNNLTYSPMVSLVAGGVNGDLEDAGVKSSTTLRWDIVKFDLLF